MNIHMYIKLFPHTDYKILQFYLALFYYCLIALLDFTYNVSWCSVHFMAYGSCILLIAYYSISWMYPSLITLILMDT